MTTRVVRATELAGLPVVTIDGGEERTTTTDKGDVEYLGSRVLSSDGMEHGSVSEVHFDETNGQIVAILGDRIGRVEASNIRSLGSYAVVIDHDPGEPV